MKRNELYVGQLVQTSSGYTEIGYVLETGPWAPADRWHPATRVAKGNGVAVAILSGHPAYHEPESRSILWTPRVVQLGHLRAWATMHHHDEVIRYYRDEAERRAAEAIQRGKAMEAARDDATKLGDAVLLSRFVTSYGGLTIPAEDAHAVLTFLVAMGYDHESQKALDNPETK